MPKSLSDFDRMLLEQDTSIKWIPENPEELILPYADQVRLTEEEKTDLEKRREKAKEAYDTYSSVIKECKELEETIEKKCKNVKIPIEQRTQNDVLQSLARVFGAGTTEITFEMYKTCIQELDRITYSVPSPEDLK